MRKNSHEPYQIGKNINDFAVDNAEMDLSKLNYFSDNIHKPGNRENGFTIGTSDKIKSMQETEQPGGISAQNDAEVKNAALEEFANKIKNAVSSKLMNGKLKLKLKGHPTIVNQVTKLIDMETKYLNALVGGQPADTPALQKNKAIIEKEAKELDRMLGTSDFWPFK